MNRLLRLFLIVVGVLLGGLTVVRVFQSWPNDSHLDHVSGAWIALAGDLRHGIFYRASFGADGYGGTRFFPLFFTLHALGIRLLGGWRAPGYVLSATSVVLLLAGVFYLLRQLQVQRWLAVASCLVVLAGSSVQDSLLTIREDGMAAMFNVFGVALCAGPQVSRRRIWLAALLFTCAFATKETSVFGAAAIFLWLLVSKRFKLALEFGVAAGLGYWVVIATMYFGSHARAFESMRLTLATGTDFRSLLKSPVTMVEAMNSYRAEMVMLILGGAALLMTSLGRVIRLPSLLFICTLAVTLVIFSSEGTAGNHLIDLLVASVGMFTVWAAEMPSPEIGLPVLAMTTLVAWLGVLVQHGYDDAVPVRSQLQAIVEKIGPTDKPILADNPLVPIVAGQRPYVLDAFMFRVLQEQVPHFGDPMWQALKARRFGAVVLVDNPDSDEGKDTYSNYHFGDDFMELMRQNYVPAGSVGTQYLFLPREK